MNLADWLAYIERQHPQSIAMGLERVRDVATCMAIGQPGRKTISLAGTNGKGSTVAFIEAMARAAGHRVGAYTSPHLHAYNERVRIDGHEATDAELVSGFAAVEAARGETPLTYFEYGTLAALWLFAQSKLDLAVLEVGLGGRLDAVNVIDADVAVITTVDIDHTDWLGPDRESIGREKAGIARPWKPLILGDVDPPSSVLRHAYLIGAQANRFGSDFFADVLPGDPQHWRWREVGTVMTLPHPQLAAPVQRTNAAVAIAALRAARLPVPRAALAEGIVQATLPGRLQRFGRDGIDVVVDVGHNPQAARQLADWLQRSPARGRTLAVFAALGDKDAPGVVAAVEAHVDRWWLAGLEEAGSRGQSVDEFAARLAGSAAGGGQRHATVALALEAALAAAAPGDRVLVFGSFHTAAAALDVLHSVR